MKKFTLLLIASLLSISFSGCNKNKDSDALPGSTWKVKDGDFTSVLKFIDDKTCSISNGLFGIDAMNYKVYNYGVGYGVDLFIYEEFDGEKQTFYAGNFKNSNTLILTRIVNEEQIAEYTMIRQ